jgi:hypothetical protein
MQHAATTWLPASADKRLAELMKVFGCADVIAPVDAEAFGRRARELLTRVAFGKRAGVFLTRVVSREQHVPQNVLKIDRVRPGGPPRVRMPFETRTNNAEKKSRPVMGRAAKLSIWRRIPHRWG